MINYLSCDFESWAYPNLPEFNKLTGEQRKKIDNGYVKRSAINVLKILAKYKTKITFFVLGQLYEWYPEVIEMIAADGHEIGFHTYSHDLLTSEEVLINSLERSKKFLDRFKPKGFRAPNIFFKKDYFQILEKYGFEYDSSTYGQLNFSEEKGFKEIPVSTFAKIPVGSGYFISLLGKNIAGIYNQINKRSPVVAFIHNWQIIKPEKSTFPDWSYLLKHPYYLPYTLEIEDIFEYLLNKFSFAQMKHLAETME